MGDLWKVSVVRGRYLVMKQSSLVTTCIGLSYDEKRVNNSDDTAVKQTAGAITLSSGNPSHGYHTMSLPHSSGESKRKRGPGQYKSCCGYSDGIRPRDALSTGLSSDLTWCQWQFCKRVWTWWIRLDTYYLNDSRGTTNHYMTINESVEAHMLVMLVVCVFSRGNELDASNGTTRQQHLVLIVGSSMI